MVPGEEIEVTVRMDSIGHRFAAGSRIRLSVSPCYWPLAWPSPEPVTLTLRHGGAAALVLPERPPRAEDDRLRPLDEPEEPEPLATTLLHGGSGGFRRIERDLASGRTDLIFDWDCGGRTRYPNGIEYEDTSVATYSIVEGDPLSARVRVENTSGHGRGDWQVSIRAVGTMTCTATTFLVTSELEVMRARPPSSRAPGRTSSRATTAEARLTAPRRPAGRPPARCRATRTQTACGPLARRDPRAAAAARRSSSQPARPRRRSSRATP